MALEDVFTDIANDNYPDSRTLILCERGLRDGAGEFTGQLWQALLDETGWTNSQLRDNRYDMVLHLVTAADGAEDFFYSQKGEGTLISETAEEDAIRKDKRTQFAWVGHPCFK
jgi:hypothetical protein